MKTTARIPEPLITITTGVEHTHGRAGAHTHKGLNGHTWVDPTLMRVQAVAVRDALVRLLPEASAALTTRHQALDADLAALAEGFAALPPLAEDEVLVASHPAYDYLARRLGWTVINRTWVPDAVPSAAELDDLGAQLEGHRARVLLWEAEPLAAAAAALRERFGLASVVFDPGETPPAPEGPAPRSWLDVQRANLERLRAALR